MDRGAARAAEVRRLALGDGQDRRRRARELDLLADPLRDHALALHLAEHARALGVAQREDRLGVVDQRELAEQRGLLRADLEREGIGP